MFQGLVGPLHPDRRRQAIGGSFIILLGAAIKYRMYEVPLEELIVTPNR